MEANCGGAGHPGHTHALDLVKGALVAKEQSRSWALHRAGCAQARGVAKPSRGPLTSLQVSLQPA